VTHPTLPANQAKSDAILVTLANIPSGRVSTYGDIAKRSGFPGLARYVASILKNLPKGSNIPWHRVINSKGKISFPPNSHMYHQQIALLKKEGIHFSDTDTVPKHFGW
tara:strand:- start:13457 stop:13780 length:324 start_codon:yes stop_codon:yes gene_type:complete